MQVALLRNIKKSIWLPAVVIVVGLFNAHQLTLDFKLEQEQRINEALNERLELVSENVMNRVMLYKFGL